MRWPCIPAMMTDRNKARPLRPGDTIGILGGGQLGRMLALAAAPLGVRCHVYCPDPESPAFDVCHRRTIAAYDDGPALTAFADAVDVVTYEFENIPTIALDHLIGRKPVHPGRKALETSQDRLTEKTFIADLDIPVADFRPVAGLDDLRAAVDAIGKPSILKTRRFGYDGKGQVVIQSDTDLAAAWASVGGAPSILEERVSLKCEISVIAARGADGTIRLFDIGENHHENQILKTTTVPASVDDDLIDQARQIARTIIAALDYVGVLGVELFVVDGMPDRLLVNEIAPRVHNSGHWTMDGCHCCQFEQHIRAVAGWPLGDPARHADVTMVNLIGDDVAAWADYIGRPQACLHLYGKREIRPGRKMGHVNIIKPSGEF